MKGNRKKDMKLYVVMRKKYKSLINKCFTLTEHMKRLSEDTYDVYYTTNAFLRKKDAKTEIQRICRAGFYQPEEVEIVTFEAKEVSDG